jgi:hypothetical protein
MVIATSGADITIVVVTTPSSYMIYHRICNTCVTSGADITFVVVTTPSVYLIYHRICNTGATSKSCDKSGKKTGL